MQPEAFAVMCERLRATELALGDGVKVPVTAELEVARVTRKSWHAVTDLAAGTILEASNVCLKRPATGLSGTRSPVGYRLKIARAADEPIRASDIIALESSA